MLPLTKEPSRSGEGPSIVRRDVQEIGGLTSNKAPQLVPWLSEPEDLARLSLIPTTRYFGSKRAQLPWLFEATRNLEFQTVLDGFGGTATVAVLFSAMGKDVTFNDALPSNVISASALLNDLPAIANSEFVTTWLEGIKPVKGTITKEFKGLYFPNGENRWLDGFMHKLGEISDRKLRHVLLHCLFQACLKKRPFNLFHRANLSLRLNCPDSTAHGNHYSWNAPFIKHFQNAFSELQQFKQVRLRKATILRAGDVARISSGFDLVYFDPPYIPRKRTIDSYHRRYHFLQGLCSYPRWRDKIVKESSIREIKVPTYTPDWHKKSSFSDLLFDLIRKHSDSTVVLSYASPGHPTSHQLTRFFRQEFSRVEVLNKKYRTALSNDERIEKLYIGRP